MRTSHLPSGAIIISNVNHDSAATTLLRFGNTEHPNPLPFHMKLELDPSTLNPMHWRFTMLPECPAYESTRKRAEGARNVWIAP